MMKRLAATAFALTLTLTACGTQGSESSGDATTGASDEGADAAAMVATTQVWADVASAVTGDEVPAIIDNPSTDPHDYEPTAADLAEIAQAKTVVANGGAYDAALYNAAKGNLITALEPTEAHDHDHEHEHGEEGHDHAHGEENEHIWYSTEAIRDVAEQIGGNPIDGKLSGIDESLAALPEAHVIQTHPIADAIVEESALVDATPESYRHATLNHSEPSAAAVAEALEAIKDADILINNSQSPKAVSERLVAAAKEAGVPVVDITETPQDGKNFFDYFQEVLDQLNAAAA
ncbi:metal ABC transporter solute-binding protein, Zn/Mn family [Corynebacterium gottingense]|uniref:metal ABC transporter solute-binding protein, Zn/Mn family n=1 Tax=Corynebacterium gottingense TaxID=2041036 RepID=UPI0025B41980|nr:zinc ABC transporter substrate-binding protein [Corynebacterium gottingense]WJZ16201.1 Metal ABC transporter substrate-binding lipoprotein precursor [Corynebacterium gottingense]